MKKRTSRTTFVVLVAFGLSACATDEFGRQRPMTDTERGAIIGAVGGAVVGGAVAKKKNRTKGILIGAVGGGLTGAAVGSYMDKQKQDLEKVLAAERTSGAIQVEKLAENVVRITMTEQTSFEFDSAEVKSGFYTTMDKIGNVVNRYGKTELTIVGHTDSAGTTEYNQELSGRRAEAVQRYLGGIGVHPERMTTEGRGESSPRASNSTPEGRRLNRRVEIYIEPVMAEG